MKTIEQFRGEFYFLSNFSPATVEVDGITYPTLEHAFQAAKAVHAYDACRILHAKTPQEAKHIGDSIACVSGWDQKRVTIMLKLLRIKFKDSTLTLKLLSTGSSWLVEGNWWHDTFWGVCQGQGKNMLGHLLMQVRDELKSSLL